MIHDEITKIKHFLVKKMPLIVIHGYVSVPFQSVSSPDTISKLQNQIKQARGVIEQLETDRQLAIAEVKQQVHEEMERKDKELAEVRSQGLAFKEENIALKEKAEKLEKAGINHFHSDRFPLKL